MGDTENVLTIPENWLRNINQASLRQKGFRGGGRFSWAHPVSQQPLGRRRWPLAWAHTLPITVACTPASVAGIPSFAWDVAPHSLIPFPLLLPLLASVPTAPSAWNSPLRSSQSSFPHWCLPQQTQSLQRSHYMLFMATDIFTVCPSPKSVRSRGETSYLSCSLSVSPLV